MDEETTVQYESEEVTDETSAAFDEGWEDADEPIVTDDGQDEDDYEDEPDTESESEETEADADQQEAEGNEGGEAAEETETEGDEGTPYPDVPIKYLGNEEVISGKDIVEYVQKGRDYDRVREKWDGVKDDVQMWQMEHAFLSELAEARGGDIMGLIDETRTRTLLARAEAAGEELSPAAAAAQAVQARLSFMPAGEQSPVDAEEARQQQVREDIERFRGDYPDVKMEDIPQEVWQEVDKNGGDLLGCYRRFENRQLKDELKNLKKELEDVKQQKKNKARSTGSMKSTGSSAGRDAFDEGWDAAY